MARPGARPPGRGSRAPAGEASRSAALDLLQSVLGRGLPLDEALTEHPGLARLDQRDRGFVRLLVATTLRRLGQIDAILARLLERPLPRKAAAVQDLLRLGLAQLLFLGTPPHAAVDSAVSLLGRRGGEAGFKGLVNAVLRRADREREALLLGAADPLLNTPDWLRHSWAAAYGEDAAATLSAVHAQEPPLDITPRGDADAWAERLDAAVLPTGSLRRPASLGGAVEALSGYGEGAWWVQDAAAAIPARLLGDVAGKRVLDLCAAPGGKTAQLAAAGGHVTSVDRSAGRMRRVEENLRRLNLEAQTVVADAAEWRPQTPAPAVLLDAPCSATGTIRRHPDIPWLKRPEELPGLAELQDRLLRAAVDMTEPGGTLVYCTCSLQPEEGPARVGALLADSAVERLPIRGDELPGIEPFLTPDGDLRTLPSHWAEAGGLDGFYIARLRRL